MARWELTMFVSWAAWGGVLGAADASNIWTKKDKQGKTEFDKLQELANDGWELVSVVPIAINEGETTHLLFTFKRPKP